MKKFISMLCVLSLCLSGTFALAETQERQATSEGGWLSRNEDGDTIYTTPDGAAEFIYNYASYYGFVGLSAYRYMGKDVVIPDTINEIPVWSVRGRKNGSGYKDTFSILETIVFPQTCETIENFRAYENLKSVVMPKDHPYMSDSVFSDCRMLESVKLPENLLTIEGRAFYNCKSLETIELNDGLSEIKISAFSGSGLKEIDIPSTVEKLETSVFSGTKNLKEIVIPSSIEEIEQGAFAYSGLENVIFNDGDTSIGNEVFLDCKSLVDVRGLTDENMVNSWEAFNGTPWQESMKEKYENLTKKDEVVPEPTEAVKEKPTQTETPTEQPTQSPTVKLTEQPTETPSESPTSQPQQTPTPQEKEVIKVVSENNALSIFANEKKIDFTDAFPFIDENGRTQIPIRAVGEALGCDVQWNETERMVRLKKENFVVTITIDSNKMTADEKTIEMDTTAKIIGERTYIPLRFAGEALGFEVEWVVK